MGIDRLNLVLPVDHVATAASDWSKLLGVTPAFVDGDAWAQIDAGPCRIALAGTDRFSERPGLMIKVDDLEAAAARARAAGFEAGDITTGAHESRCLVAGPNGTPVMFYAARR